jgi:TatA/E family protein of Tat protein translocase
MDLIGGHLPELIILLVVILIIWGPGKLPDVGSALGRGLREFRKASAETRDAVRNATAPEEPAADAPASAVPAADPEPEPVSSTGGPAGPEAS